MKSQEADAALEQLFTQARKQFGQAIKGFWFYEPDPCPGCGRAIDAMKHQGQRAMSLNAFIYRERGILIGYILCSRCGKLVIQAGQTNPSNQTPLHATIEANLIKAYLHHLH